MSENSPGSGPARSGRPPIQIIGALAAVVVVGIVIVVVALGSGGGKKNSNSDTEGSHAGLATFVPTPQATIDIARPTVEAAQNLTTLSQGDRLMIPSIGVDAVLSYHVVGKDGVMPNPDGEDDIAYYDFSNWAGKGGAPGKGGNAIFAGHVDSGFAPCKHGTVPPPCESVLWDLTKLKIGDEINVQVGGTTFKYKVTSSQPVNASTGPWDEIVSSTAQESITIITCGGDFNRVTHEYTNRQVVTAIRST